MNRATRSPPAGLKVENFRGARTRLLPLFALADDSPEQIRSYIDLGEVLVARFGKEIVGHLQILIIGQNREIRSLAVMEERQKQGIGSCSSRQPSARHSDAEYLAFSFPPQPPM